MQIDLQAADFFIKLFDLIFRILVLLVIPALVVLIRQIFKMRTDQKVLEQRTCALEGQVAAMPGDKSMHDLALTLERLNGTVGGMGKVMERLEKVVDRHEEYLQQRGR
jgi:hypothetical protein